MSVTHCGKTLGEFSVPLTGAHNMENSLAAIAVANELKCDLERVRSGLLNFRGVARRQQVRGVAAGVTVIDDFAHHPTAIEATLRGLRGVHGEGRLIAVFEPRSATSRRKTFQDLFVVALAVADRAIVAPCFAPERIAANERLDVAQLVATLNDWGTPAEMLPAAQIPSELASTCRPGDTVVLMSSGGFDNVHDNLLAALAEIERG